MNPKGVYQIIGQTIKKASSLILCRPKTVENSVFDYQVLVMEEKDYPYIPNLRWPNLPATPQDKPLCKKFGINSELYVPSLNNCLNDVGLFLSENAKLSSEQVQRYEELRKEYLQKSPTLRFQDRQSFEKACEFATPQKNLQPVMRYFKEPTDDRQQVDMSLYLTSLEEGKFLNFGKRGVQHMYNSDAITCQSRIAHEVYWNNPYEILKQYKMEKIYMTQAHFMLLNIMSKFHTYREMMDFIVKCNNPGNLTNMGANFFQMLDQETSPYVAPFLGDYEYQYEKLLNNQNATEELKQQIDASCAEYQSRQLKNRVIFHTTELFAGDFDVECTVENSILNAMRGSKQLWEEVEAHT